MANHDETKTHQAVVADVVPLTIVVGTGVIVVIVVVVDVDVVVVIFVVADDLPTIRQ